MATMVESRCGRLRPITADAYETGPAVAASALLVVVSVALAKGHTVWAQVPVVIWAYLATVCKALALTPVMLLRPRGDALHRALGKVWIAAMTLTAAESFLVRFSDDGRFSFIQAISVGVPFAAHRRYVRGLVTGAIVIAGSFTMLSSRMLGQWLFA